MIDSLGPFIGMGMLVIVGVVFWHLADKGADGKDQSKRGHHDQ